MVSGLALRDTGRVRAHSLICQVLEVVLKVSDLPHFQLSRPCHGCVWKHREVYRESRSLNWSGVPALYPEQAARQGCGCDTGCGDRRGWALHLGISAAELEQIDPPCLVSSSIKR